MVCLEPARGSCLTRPVHLEPAIVATSRRTLLRAGQQVGGNVKEGAEEGVDSLIEGAKDAAKKVTGQDK